jgi:AbiEi antitoxin C-terminal domain
LSISSPSSLVPHGLSIANAKLPKIYESARVALAECSRIDECKDWADKAEALASYARQADDDSLRKTADRIQARAIRRCGELLKEMGIIYLTAL